MTLKRNRGTAAAMAFSLLIGGMAMAAENWQGAAVEDANVRHGGTPSWRWELAKGDSVSLPLSSPAPDQGTLSLWVHSSRMTGAKIDLALLCPDADNRFSTRFSVEWTGWNHIQLERGVLRREGAADWSKATTLELRGEQGFAPPTVLHLGPVVWTDASPLWEMDHGEVMVEPLYHSQFSVFTRWQPDDATNRMPKGTARLTRRWNALVVERRRTGDAPATATYWRPLNVDLAEIRGLRVQAALPTDATFGMSAMVDGALVEVVPPSPGKGNWTEYSGRIAGKVLQGVYLHCGDVPGQLTARSPRHVEYHFHFLTAETKDFQIPEYPAQAPRRELSDVREPREPLLEKGLPAWLYFGRDDIPALREKIRTGLAADMFAQLKKRADSTLGYDPTPYEGAPFYPQSSHEWLRPWTPSQPWGNMAEECAFMYVLTDDLRYAEQARRVLLAMASLGKWNYGMVSKYPVGWGGHGGPFCEGTNGPSAAAAYNWIHNTLTDEERRRIEDAMLWKSWYWLNDYVDTRDYIRAMNQGPWFNSGALIQAVVLAHRFPWLRDFYRKYEANIKESIGLCYFRDGANTEGAAYWGATTRYIARSLPLLAHEFGTPLADYVPEPLARSIDMPIYMRSMVSDGFNVLGVNDGNYGAWNPGDTGLFFAAPLDLPQAQWAWQETAGRSRSYGDLVMSLIWYRDWGRAQPESLSLGKQFRGVGWIVLRSGWEVGDILFCLQSGIWGRGHQHLDKNSFVLEAYGERLCPDKGVPAYGDARGPFFQKTLSHNVITIDGADQVRANPKVLRFEHSDAVDLIDSDATANYPGARKVIRRVLFMRPSYVVIADEVETHRPSVIELNLHTFGRIGVDGDEVVFEGENADLLIRVLSPTVFTHTLDQTQRAPNEPPVHDIRLTTPDKTTETVFLTVLYPLRKGQERPDIAVDRNADGAVIRVSTDGRVDRVLWRDDGTGMHVEETAP